MLEHRGRTERIVWLAIEVHRQTGPGLLASVHAACLAFALPQRPFAALLLPSCLKWRKHERARRRRRPKPLTQRCPSRDRNSIALPAVRATRTMKTSRTCYGTKSYPESYHTDPKKRSAKSLLDQTMKGSPVMRSSGSLAAALITATVLLGGSALANTCRTEKLTCPTTMPPDGYCECTTQGATEPGTVTQSDPHQRQSATPGGCGTDPHAPGCR